MVFYSFIFLFIFLPLGIAGYYFLNNRKHYELGKFFLFAMSLWFFGYVSITFIPLILFSIGLNYFLALWMKKTSSLPARRTLLITGILFHLGLLFYYKYWGFLLFNVNQFFKTDYFFLQVTLPLGISYFTFQHIAFLVDTLKGKQWNYTLLDYSLYIVFFPKLSSGPIALHYELIPQFQDASKKSFSFENFSKGLLAFSFGMAKKVLLADVYGRVVNWGFTNIPVMGSTNGIIAMVAYTLQIYFDFSGYCDMAAGICLMLNIDLPMNFFSPYRSKSIKEFWDKWHMTLTRFFRQYLYFPLGGSRKGSISTFINIMIIFLISGLWHGANWTFLLWGFIHGIGMILSRILRGKVNKVPDFLKWLFTFLFVNVAWIYFRADSIFIGNQFILSILSWRFTLPNINMLYDFVTPEMDSVVTIMELFTSNTTHIYYAEIVMLIFFFAFGIFAVVKMKNTNERLLEFKPTKKTLFLTIFLLTWSILSMSGVSSFLYVNF